MPHILAHWSWINKYVSLRFSDSWYTYVAFTTFMNPHAFEISPQNACKLRVKRCHHTSVTGDRRPGKSHLFT